MSDGTPFLRVAADRIGAPGSARIAGKNAIPRHQRRQLGLNHPDRREDGCHSKANCTSSGFEPHSTGWEVSIWGIPTNQRFRPRRNPTGRSRISRTTNASRSDWGARNRARTRADSVPSAGNPACGMGFGATGGSPHGRSSASSLGASTSAGRGSTSLLTAGPCSWRMPTTVGIMLRPGRADCAQGPSCQGPATAHASSVGGPSSRSGSAMEVRMRVSEMTFCML